MRKTDTDKAGVDVPNSPITSKAYISKSQIIANVSKIIKILTTTEVKAILLLLTKSKLKREFVSTRRALIEEIENVHRHTRIVKKL